MGAYDLLERIKSQTDRPADPPTVYKTLDFILEKGLNHHLTTINTYKQCRQPREGHQAAFLLCTERHTAKEASSQGLTHQLDQLAA